MPEEVEIETNELAKTVEEMREERVERVKDAKEIAWTRWISLSTALLAVIAAIAALESGALVNEAMLDQLKASDLWNQYQATRQKEYLFTLQTNALLDAGARLPDTTEKSEGAPKHTSGEANSASAKPAWRGLPADARVKQYIGKVAAETDKEADEMRDAKEQEEAGKHHMHLHHTFAYCVTFTQVAIALSAVAALTRRKPVWYFSMLVGAGGIAWFVLGVVGK